jgi:YVTN family beta-propeller protein
VLADSVISTVKVGRGPSEIAFNPINNSMYIINTADRNGVSLIDGRSNKFLTNIATFCCAGNVAFNSNNNNMYVANGSFVAVISAKDNKVIKNISTTVGIDAAHELDIIPNAIAFNPKNGDMYVPSIVSYFNAKQTPFVNDLNNCLRNATLSCVVLVIDSHNNEIVKNIPIGRQGEGQGIIAYNPKNGNMYVGNDLDKTISVIDSKSNQVVKTIHLSGSPSAIAYNPKNGNMYVAGGASNVVSVIDPNNNVKPISGVGNIPNAIAFNPKNGNMYVAGGFSKSIFVIDSKYNNITNIPLGVGPNAVPNAIAYNPKNGNMYVTIGFDNVVKVIDSISNKVVDTIPVRQGAFKIALDPIDNDMYVTNSLDNTVSIIG